MNSLKLDIGLSVGLHVVVITAVLLAGAISGARKWNQGEIIRVSLSGGPISAVAPVMTPAPAAKPSAPAVQKSVPIPANAKALPGSKKLAKEQPKKKGVPRNEQASYEAERAENEIQSDATGTGSPFAGASIDNANFDYPYWFDQAFTKIQSNWTNNVAVDGTVVCVVYFQIIRSGRLLEARVVTTSGIAAFDQGCLAAITKSAPFPPLPADFTDEIIGITLPFKFEPR